MNRPLFTSLSLVEKCIFINAIRISLVNFLLLVLDLVSNITICNVQIGLHKAVNMTNFRCTLITYMLYGIDIYRCTYIYMYISR